MDVSECLKGNEEVWRRGAVRRQQEEVSNADGAASRDAEAAETGRFREEDFKSNGSSRGASQGIGFEFWRQNLNSLVRWVHFEQFPFTKVPQMHLHSVNNTSKDSSRPPGTATATPPSTTDTRLHSPEPGGCAPSVSPSPVQQHGNNKHYSTT